MPSKFTADALNTDYGDELARPPLSDTKTPRVPNRVQIMQSTRTEDAAIVCGGTDNEGLDAEVWGCAMRALRHFNVFEEVLWWRAVACMTARKTTATVCLARTETILPANRNMMQMKTWRKLPLDSL
jgi:hypothetical protein